MTETFIKFHKHRNKNKLDIFFSNFSITCGYSFNQPEILSKFSAYYMLVDEKTIGIIDIVVMWSIIGLLEIFIVSTFYQRFIHLKVIFRLMYDVSISYDVNLAPNSLQLYLTVVCSYPLQLLLTGIRKVHKRPMNDEFIATCKDGDL